MLRSLIALLLTGIMAVATYVFSVTRELPSVEKVLKDGINPTQWTQVFAADGSPIMSFGKFRHENVKLTNVSPYFVDALIATEDRRFYEHKGVDPIAVLRAVVRDLSHKKLREGGSTITQQLARNVFLSNERSITRKIREAALAMQLEDKLTKAQILELYVNNTYFGEGAYGIQAASEIYFGKKPSRLSITEAAMLAGMPQAPSGYNPFQNLKGAKARRDEVLQNLVEVGKITPEQFERYKNQPIYLNQGGRGLSSSDKAPFFNRYVMTQVMRYFNLDEQSFWQSGLKIFTTLDLRAQNLAQSAVVSQSAVYGRTRNNQQAAVVSMNPQSGAILAYVGGKNYQNSQFDRVIDAVRSPGSLFKIFTYTTAIDRGYEPSRVYLDEPVKIAEWQPKNYDRSYHGYMTIARAVITSNNVVAVKVINELGADAVVRMAEQMGIRTPMEPYLGLTLGGSGVKLMEITSAFGVLANQGVRVEPYAIDKIVDDSGHEIYREHPVKTNVLNRTTVDTMVKMMAAVITRGTGKAGAIGRPTAGKTGTSDDYRDAWFVAFTPDVVTGVWVGNDNNTTMPGMTGGSLPASIWRSFMSPYMANRPVKNFDLAYSKALEDTDFVTYNIKNLSDKDSGSAFARGEVQDGEIQQDPVLDPLSDLDSDSAPASPSGEEASGSEAGRVGYEPNPADNTGRVALPAAPVENQPPAQQPMPGYGTALPARTPEPKVGYGVIPIERGRRGGRDVPAAGAAQSFGAAPVVPTPENADVNRGRY
ncbi:PBP1A family penicillin-binding protein [Vampirovibrio sp.]|uniref:transglycosylase domain-containing protein n=1 Tax=Vampirovibrio sp. TaxID=2717857 RepID=UPI003592F7B9